MGVLLAAVPLAALAAFEALVPLGDAFGELASGRAAATRTFEVIDAPVPVAAPDAPVAVPDAPSLALDGVRFRFASDDAWILDGLDLALTPGERLGLTGPNGAGRRRRSGCCSGSSRRSRARTGSVTATPPRTMPTTCARCSRSCRRSVPVQRILRDNLLLADADAPDDRIRAACERAQLGRLVDRLPEGLDTPVGEDGIRLSGGERRRLAVARVSCATCRSCCSTSPRPTSIPPRNATFSPRSPAREGAEPRRGVAPDGGPGPRVARPGAPGVGCRGPPPHRREGVQS